MASITSRAGISTASAARRSASLVAPVPLPQRMCFQAASPEQRAPARASVMARVASAVRATKKHDDCVHTRGGEPSPCSQPDRRTGTLCCRLALMLA